jgi:GNAT superfamily N-acetyltransferase
MQITVRELTVPLSVDAADAAEYIAAIDLINEAEAADLGTSDLGYPPVENLPWWHRSWEPKSLFGVFDGERLVAASELTLSDESADTAWVHIAVAPDHRRQGIGRVLMRHAIGFSKSAGRTTMQASSSEVPSSGGSRIPSPTGSGSLRTSTPAVAFLIAEGFELGQVDRISRLALPAVDVAEHRTTAEAASTDYAVVRWVGRTPEEYLDASAALSNAIQADAPHADLDPGLTAWDAAKVAADDDAKASSPRIYLTVMAFRRDSGDVAGYSVLAVPPGLDRAVSQGDTVVLAAHRGHRLGMLLKLANIHQLEEVLPDHPSIVTYNAEENRFMLSVNEAIGFVPIGYEGGWKRAV